MRTTMRSTSATHFPHHGQLHVSPGSSTLTRACPTGVTTTHRLRLLELSSGEYSSPTVAEEETSETNNPVGLNAKYPAVGLVTIHGAEVSTLSLIDGQSRSVVSPAPWLPNVESTGRSFSRYTRQPWSQTESKLTTATKEPRLTASLRASCMAATSALASLVARLLPTMPLNKGIPTASSTIATASVTMSSMRVRPVCVDFILGL